MPKTDPADRIVECPDSGDRMQPSSGRSDDRSHLLCGTVFCTAALCQQIAEKYGLLLKATNEIAQGNLNVTIEEDLGVFEPFKPQIYRIEEGFRNAVAEEVKSQRMKSELITNVSHDLKTPLTAIITYVKLLQEPGVTEEQRKEYLETLDRKSLRLKALIEDLFEVSKANSQNITLDIRDVDIVSMVKQVEFEMEDKLADAGLDVRMSMPEEKVIVPLDSQKTFRILKICLAILQNMLCPGPESMSTVLRQRMR